MSDIHLWQGQWLEDGQLETRLAGLGDEVGQVLEHPPEISAVIGACGKFSDALRSKGGIWQALLGELPEPEELDAVSEFLRAENLVGKLERELGGEGGPRDSFQFSRISHREPIFERWAPLGFMVHVAPTNAPAAGALSVIEGLLAGNSCFLKTGGSDGLFAQRFFESLFKMDTSGSLSRAVWVARIPSHRQDLLRNVLAHADGIAAWGGSGAIEGIRKLAPRGARMIEWGPKISFAYVSREALRCDPNETDWLTELARQCCVGEQQACSSPQCVYVETDEQDPRALKLLGQRLAAALAVESPRVPRTEPSLDEAAEISWVTEICAAESCLGLSQVHVAPDGGWRVLVERNSQLEASPLYRTVRVKPLSRDRLIQELRPAREFLQTVGLVCGRSEWGELSQKLIRAGALRVAPVGKMLESYVAEPHDGVYALQRYSRRVSLRTDPSVGEGISCFADLLPGSRDTAHSSARILSKADFQSLEVEPRYQELFFKSGGSSGDPKLSVFTYDDYRHQMRLAGEGLYAAGLDPASDRCMNLFFGGGLYGGLISFFSILESLKAVQFPMAAHPDTRWVASVIVERKVTALLGMPSYLLQLFRENAEVLGKYRGVKKIFYGGEHLSEAQRDYLRREFGVERVKSAAYGSVDAGPLGYQCRYCEGAVHHLHSRLQHLEILDLEKDQPVAEGQAGRLVLTSLSRRGQRLERYEIGDIGRWIPGACECGRLSARFELLGRHGDVFRVGGTFVSYSKLARIVSSLGSGLGSDRGGYSGEVQVRLSAARGESPEALTILLDQEFVGPQDVAGLRAGLLEEYSDLRDAVQVDRLLELRIELVKPGDFNRTPGSGKLIHVVEARNDARNDAWSGGGAS